MTGLKVIEAFVVWASGWERDGRTVIVTLTPRGLTMRFEIVSDVKRHLLDAELPWSYLYLARNLEGQLRTAFEAAAGQIEREARFFQEAS